MALSACIDAVLSLRQREVWRLSTLETASGRAGVLQATECEACLRYICAPEDKSEVGAAMLGAAKIGAEPIRARIAHSNQQTSARAMNQTKSVFPPQRQGSAQQFAHDHLVDYALDRPTVRGANSRRIGKGSSTYSYVRARRSTGKTSFETQGAR